MVLVPKWPGWLRGSWKSKGLCTLKLPQDAHFGFQVKFVSELWARKGSSISSHFKVKTGIILYFLSDLSFGIILQGFLGGFEFILDTVWLFLKEQWYGIAFLSFWGHISGFWAHFGHCSIVFERKNNKTLFFWVFGHISVFCVRFFGIRVVPELFWVKNLRKGDF